VSAPRGSGTEHSTSEATAASNEPSSNGSSRAHRVFHPVLAVGTMPLTAYTRHLLAVWAIGPGEDYTQRWLLLAATIATTMTLAVIWLRYFQSGPLETGLRTHRQRRRQAVRAVLRSCVS
jgi:uncharacterized membrane protein YeiB